MNLNVAALALLPGLFWLGVADAQQYPILDRVTQKVVAKYQNTSCQQLQAERARPPSGQRADAEQRAVRLLHEDPQMRQEFINRAQQLQLDDLAKTNDLGKRITALEERVAALEKAGAPETLQKRAAALTAAH